MNEWNILISSVSSKVPMIIALRKSIDKLGCQSKIIGADSNKNCIGKHFVDVFWEMPLIDNISIENLIAYCTSHQIKAIIPTRNGELSFYAKHREALAAEKITVMVSNLDAISICLDKLLFSKTLLSLGFPAIPATESLDVIPSHEFVVKERKGAGSERIGIKLTREQALHHAKTLRDPVFQPYVQGPEFSIDLYLDKAGDAKGAIARKRDLVIRGESQITTTLSNHELENLCIKIGEALGLYGHVLFQAIQNVNDNNFYIVECNPRFGGASTLSLEVGLDSFVWFIAESQGLNLKKFPFKRYEGEKRLIRHAEDKIGEICTIDV